MEFKAMYVSRLITVLILLSATIILGCEARIGKHPIPSNEVWYKPIETFTEVIKLDPESTGLNEVIQYLNLHQKTGWRDMTEDQIQRCADVYISSPKIFELVSSFYLNRSDLEKALLYSSKAESLGASSSDFYKNKADLYTALGDFGLAIDYLNQVVAINENDPDIYMAKGDVYLKLKDSTSALVYKEQAFEHDSSRLDIAYDLAHIYGAAGRVEEAFVLSDFLIEQQFRADDLSFLKVSLLKKEGNQSAANSFLEEMLNNGNVKAGEDLISFYFSKNFYDSAIHYSTTVLAYDSINMSALEAKAASFDHKGYFTSALMYYNQMLAIDSLNKEAKEGIRKVNGKIAYLRKLREQREAIPTFDFATDKKETN